MKLILAAVCLVAMACLVTEACIYPYGSKGEAKKKGTHFDYNFAGDDWAEKFPACKGTRQSPLLLQTTGPVATMPGPMASSFKYGKLDGKKLPMQLINNGHTVQLTWPQTYAPDVTIAVPAGASKLTDMLTMNSTASRKVTRVKARPAQLHFHARSEHVLGGVVYPLEMHIVHFVESPALPKCPKGGCIAVLGIMFHLTDNTTQAIPALQTIVDMAPLDEQETVNITKQTIDLDALLPKNRSYMTYEGSLTAPPCIEGLLWHVMTQSIPITRNQLRKLSEAMGDSDCPAGTDTASAQPASVTTPGAFQRPPPGKDGCWKIADAHNYRDIQQRNNRVIKMVKA